MRSTMVSPGSTSPKKMQGLKRFAGVDMHQTSDDFFSRQIFCVLKMDASVPVDSRVFMTKRAVWK